MAFSPLTLLARRERSRTLHSARKGKGSISVPGAISGNINVAIKLVSTGTKTGKGFTGSAAPTAENLGAYSKERNFVNEDL